MQDLLAVDSAQLGVEAKLTQLAKLKRLQLQWVKKHRIYFYQPLLNQAKYHASRAHIRLVVGTNRSGKTTCGSLDDIAFWLGFYPWLLPEELQKVSVKELIEGYHTLPKDCLTPIKPPIRCLIVVADWDTADEIWTVGTDESAGKFALYLPLDALVGRPEKNNMGNICAYTCLNGSILRLDTQKSFVNDPQSFEGKVWHKIHYDEPPPRELRVAASRGLVDTRGFEDFTMTPLTEAWIKDEVYDKAASNPQIETFFLSAEENPYISKEGWADFTAKLDETEYAARAKGEWVFLKGLVYKNFIPKKFPDGHLIEPVTVEWLKQNAAIYYAIDPHPRQPHAVLFLAADKKGRLLIWEEIYKECLIEELCDFVKAKLAYVTKPTDGSKPEAKQLMSARRVIDPLAFEQDPVDKHTWADEFFQNGIFLEPASKRRAAGIVSVRAALQDKQLLICSNCTRLIWEFQHYCWDEYQSRLLSTRNPKEKPKDKDDHMMENLYRLILLQPSYIELEEVTEPIEEEEDKILAWAGSINMDSP